MVNDTIANEQANLALTLGGAVYKITDSAANVIAAAPSYVAGASAVALNDAAVSYATLTSGVNSVAAVRGGSGPATLVGVTYKLSDTAANLFTGGAVNNANGAAAGASTVTVTTAVTGAQANSLVGVHAANNTFSISDSVANLFAGGAVAVGMAAVVTAAGAVTVTGGSLSDAQAASLVTTHTSGANTYGVSDTAANLFSGAALKAEVSGAQTVAVTTTLTVAQGNVLTGLGAKFTGGYTITDSSANLATGSSALLQGATTVTAGGAATVAQEVAIQAALGSHTLVGGYTISDTAAAIAGASQALLTGATLVTATGQATAAQGVTLAGETYNGTPGTHVTYQVTDTSANILAAGNAAAFGGNDSKITVTDTINVATANLVHALTVAGGGTYAYQISDTSSVIELAASAVVNAATVATVTDTVDTATGNLVLSLQPGATFSFAKITDTIANLNGNAALLAKAVAVSQSASDAPTVASVETFLGSTAASKLTGGYKITDSAANVLQAFWDQDHHNQITGASSVSLTAGTETVAQAGALEGIGNLVNSTLHISDTLAAVNGATAGVLNVAADVTVAINENVGATVQVFNDLALTPSSTLVFTHGAGGAQVVTQGGGAGTAFTLAGDSLLTLKGGDTVDLHGYALASSSVVAAGAAALTTNGVAELVQGFVTNAGATFTPNAGGNSTMVLFDADSSGAVAQAAVVLVGVTTANIDLFGANVAGHVHLTNV